MISFSHTSRDSTGLFATAPTAQFEITPTFTTNEFGNHSTNYREALQRVLDAGVLGVIFPFCSSPELAQQAVAACKYPPAGRRGSGAGLATFRWPSAEPYYDFADRNGLVIAVIEEVSAVEQIDEIAATPGLDVLFVGPSDLSFSLGLRGDMAHPRVQAAMSRVVAAAQRAIFQRVAVHVPA